MTVTACIVQARMASTRLPGKVMRTLRGETVLRHVLTRCAAVPGVDVVVCAVPEGHACDELAAEAAAGGALVFRGSESDVLSRYHGAASMVGADVVLRVTSDCPLIDPGVCGAVLALRARENAGYACNNLPPSWPIGLDCEAFPASLLARAHREAADPFQREHVGPWMRTNPDVAQVNYPSPDPALAGHRWTLDHPEDFALFEAVFAHLPPEVSRPTTAEVLAVVTSHPEIMAINGGLRPHPPKAGGLWKPGHG